MSTFPLPFVGEVTIGSADTADVRVTDPSIAERHAVLSTGAQMSLRDLGSGAATIVGSRRLTAGEASPLSPGVVVLLGGVTMVVQASGASTRLRHVRSHDYFEGRLEDECARAEGNRSPFGVVRLRFSRHQAQAVEEAFTRHLRPIDLVAMYAADEYELLLSDADAERVAAIAELINQGVKERGLGELVVGVACWPGDASSPEALLAAAGVALHGRPEITPPRVLTSGAIEALRPLVERVAQTTINVLILGETGVGKEVLARRIHELSPRVASPLLCVNCAALNETLLESELFGHERGAFTGAVQAKPGLLEVAEGGTVLLDELGEMPLTVQAKLLRVVEQQTVTRVGGIKARHIDVRFVAATHRDLELEILRGRFRQDLYYRLNGVSIVVPPLRERVNEIRPLAEEFAADCARKGGRPAPKLTSSALRALERYAWPGNVRELRNVMERAVMLSAADLIDLDHLPVERLGRTLPLERPSELPFYPQPRAATLPPPAATASPVSRLSFAPPVSPLPAESPLPSPPPESVFLSARPGVYSFAPAAVKVAPRDEPEDEPDDERARILRALERCAGNQTHAARQLGMSRRTLISRIERYNLPRPRKRDDGTGP
jgi:two-component system, NtrC family, response regulator AtoC